MELDIQSQKNGATCTVTLEGEVDVYTAPRLKEELVSLIHDGCTHVVIDLDQVGFIDSSGLGVLVSALRRSREKDGTVSIVCSRDAVLKIFRITGLDKVFPIYSSVQEASES